MASTPAGPTSSGNQTAGQPPVITIFEQFGAGAESIGRPVAEALGQPFHVQAFTSAELEAGPQRNVTETLADRATLASVFSVMGGAYGGFEGRDVITTQQERRDLITDNNETVRGFAREGGVIMGRNATVILADRPNTIHVLLTGDVEDRIRRGAEFHNIDTDKARRRQRREDQVRVDMSKVLYGWDPFDPSRYDLVINTSRIPTTRAIAAIVDTVRDTEA